MSRSIAAVVNACSAMLLCIAPIESVFGGVDAWLADGDIAVRVGEFSISVPLDERPVPGVWVYIIRYHERIDGAVPFGIAVTRTANEGEFVLALYEGATIGDLNKIPPERRVAEATRTRTVKDRVLVDAIYAAAWIGVLKRSTFGVGIGRTMLTQEVPPAESQAVRCGRGRSSASDDPTTGAEANMRRRPAGMSPYAVRSPCRME